MTGRQPLKRFSRNRIFMGSRTSHFSLSTINCGKALARASAVQVDLKRDSERTAKMDVGRVGSGWNSDAVSLGCGRNRTRRVLAPGPNDLRVGEGPVRRGLS